MDINKFISNLEDALEISQPGSITPDSNFKELEEWDSLTVLSFIAMIDSEYKTIVSTQELRERTTVQDLFNLIISKI